MTINITPKLNEPAIEPSVERFSAGNSSPSNKYGIQPKPIENPIMNTTRLINGKSLRTKNLQQKNIVLQVIQCLNIVSK